MPKMKTNRGAAKRFKKTASGYKRKNAFKNHILTKKDQKRNDSSHNKHSQQKGFTWLFFFSCFYLFLDFSFISLNKLFVIVCSASNLFLYDRPPSLHFLNFVYKNLN